MAKLTEAEEKVRKQLAMRKRDEIGRLLSRERNKAKFRLRLIILLQEELKKNREETGLNHEEQVEIVKEVIQTL